eukprot:1153558-Pelagomonas_calceolata.AAC.10
MEGSRAWQSRDCFLYGIGVSLAFNIFVGGAAIVIQPWLAGYYTPAPFTPGPPPAFTPGPEAAAFAAALEAGLPLSQVEQQFLITG